MRRESPPFDRLNLVPPSDPSLSALSGEAGRPNRGQGPSSEDHRTVGWMLALGATLGAAVGAAIGADSGDVGHWMGMGIPVGITVVLGAGGVFSKPARRGPTSGTSTISWIGSDDDAVPRPPQALDQR